MADNKADAKPKLRSMRPDFATIGGLVVAVGGILGGLILDNGKISDVTQITAAIIVLGGTIGAVMVTSPLSSLFGALGGLKNVFMEEVLDLDAAVEIVIAFATKARKSSIISLEEDLDKIDDPFLRKALTLAVDGTDLQELHKMMQLELYQTEKRAESEAKVFEAAGGYAPTIGIIGAVLGLIQVMQHLDKMDEVGRGIAVAFVATIYGVGVANIFFLPAAGKLKIRMREEQVAREMMLEGVVSILEGLNPRMVEIKLNSFLSEASKSAESKTEEEKAA